MIELVINIQDAAMLIFVTCVVIMKTRRLEVEALGFDLTMLISTSASLAVLFATTIIRIWN